MMKRALLGATIALLVFGACRPDTVDLSYRLEQGQVLTYSMVAEATAEWDIGGQGSGSYRVVFDVTETIRSTDATGATIEVRMAPSEIQEGGLPSPGPEPRLFSLRVAPDGEVLEVIEVDGVPAEALQPDELAFIGTYRPPMPGEAVRLNDSWTAEQELELTSVFQQVAILGTLERVGVQDGKHVAEIAYDGQGPLVWTTNLPQGSAELTGSATSTSEAIFDVRAGILESATSLTSGTFVVRVIPDEQRAPVEGTLDLELRLRLRRVADDDPAGVSSS